MTKVNVENWFDYEDSKKLENQVKFYIANTVEGYLNGIYDDNYPSMTKTDWISYVWDCIEYDKGTYVNGNESSHLYFYGKEKTQKLIETYLDNYCDVQKFIVKGY